MSDSATMQVDSATDDQSPAVADVEVPPVEASPPVAPADALMVVDQSDAEPESAVTQDKEGEKDEEKQKEARVEAPSQDDPEEEDALMGNLSEDEPDQAQLPTQSPVVDEADPVVGESSSTESEPALDQVSASDGEGDAKLADLPAHISPPEESPQDMDSLQSAEGLAETPAPTPAVEQAPSMLAEAQPNNIASPTSEKLALPSIQPESNSKSPVLPAPVLPTISSTSATSNGTLAMEAIDPSLLVLNASSSIPSATSSPVNGTSTSTANGDGTHNKGKRPLFLPAKDSDKDDAEEDDELVDDSSEDEGPLAFLPAPSHKAVASTSAASASASAVSSPKKPSKPRASVGSASGSHSASHNIPLPHYTVQRNSNPKGPHKIIIKPGVTDGSSSRWPPDHPPGYTIKGARNWYEEIPRDQGKHLTWRKELGMELAKFLRLQTEFAGGKTDEWILDDFPEDYKFYIHHSGSAAGKERTDPYCFGSYATAKFRTKAEIFPHLYWLISNGPGQPVVCACKYCSKNKSQKDVNARLGIAASLSNGQSAGSPAPEARPAKKRKLNGTQQSPAPDGPSRKGKEKERSPSEDSEVPNEKKKKRLSTASSNAKPTNSTSSAAHLKSALKKPTAPKAEEIVEPDYNGAYSDEERERDLSEGAAYRVSELIWVGLENPFLDTHTNDPERAIKYWPGVIEARAPTAAPTVLVDHEAGGKKSLGKTVQRWKYEVKLLALSDSVTRPSEVLLPWLAYSSPACLTDASQFDERSLGLVWNSAKGKARHPKLSSITSARDAGFAYCLAIQISAGIVNGYSLGDRFSINQSFFVASGPVTNQTKAEQDVLCNAWHYQYFHWGSEKIWTGEIVRLMCDSHLIDTLPVLRNLTEPSDDKLEILFKIETVYCHQPKPSSKTADSPMPPTCRMVGTLLQLVDASDPRLEKRSPEDDKRKGIPAPPAPHLAYHVAGHANCDLELDYVAGRLYDLQPELQSRNAIDSVQERDRLVLQDYREKNPMLDHTGIHDEREQELLSHDMKALALAGIVPGYRLYMRCGAYRSDRATCMKKAEKTATMEMTAYLQKWSKVASK